MKLKLITPILSIALIAASVASNASPYSASEKEAIKQKIIEMNKRCQVLETATERSKCHKQMVGKYNSMMRQAQSVFIKKHAPSPAEIHRQGR